MTRNSRLKWNEDDNTGVVEEFFFLLFWKGQSNLINKLTDANTQKIKLILLKPCAFDNYNGYFSK